MWNFKVGDEVVCVDDQPLRGTRGWYPGSCPELGQVYTIKEIGTTVTGDTGIRLHEIMLCGGRGVKGIYLANLFYAAWRFRPLKSFSLDALLSTKVDIGDMQDA